MTQKQFIELIGPLATADYQKTGVLASITIAQACLESAYGTSELAVNARNYFGMKKNLSGNTWKSAWDGKSFYTKKTGEEYVVGVHTTITADFRKYPSLEKSIEDHSLYLTQAKNGNKLRYAGLKGCSNYKKAAQIIKDGGYATSSTYVSKLCNLITKWNLTQYDLLEKKEETTVGIKINQNPNFGTHNTSARSGNIEYIVIHYVGATGDAKANINYYNQRSTTNASADFYVGHSGDIWQYNPDPLKRYCWAVGGKKQSSYGGSLYGIAKNANCVSIEMCVKNSTGNKTANSSGWYFTDATVNSTIELTKYLMKLYNIPANRVIRHFDINGKYCPGVYGWNSPSGSEIEWNNFKTKIGSAGSSSVVTTKPTESASKIDFPNPPFIVKVLVDNLNYRSEPSMNGTIKGQTKKGKFTIIQVKDGWGLLKSYASKRDGWIYLENPNYVEIDKSSISSSYKVRITADALNVRKGAGTNYEVVTTIRDKGIYTIVEESNGWGLLKSYASKRDGWISLKYTKKA